MQQFILEKISEVRDCLIAEIRERELMSKMLSKYIASFDCFEKIFIILSGTGGRISMALFATVIGVPAGIASANVSLTFSVSTDIVKNCYKQHKIKKKA